MSAWLLWCVLLAGTLGSGAWAGERALRAAGRPSRGVWAAALLLSAGVPLASLALRPDAPPPPAFPVEYVSTMDTMDASAFAPTVAEAAPVPEPGWLDRVGRDRLILLGWGGTSAAVLLWLAGSSAGLALRRRRWRRAAVDGVPVLVSASTGPAVVGALRPRVVLPEWALAEPPEARRLMVAHEAEHLRAGDPRLLLAGLLCAAAAPWNPLLWWQLRRLRAAVEVDCDARVLAGGADLRAYATLLIEVGRRASAVHLPAAALAARPSLLERRIRTMTLRTERARRRVGLLVVPCAAATLAAAAHAPEPPDVEEVFASAVEALGWQAPQPEVVVALPIDVDVPMENVSVAPLGVSVGAEAVTMDGGSASEPDELGIGRLQRIFERHRPASLRAVEVFAHLRAVIDSTGAARDVKLLHVSHPAAEPALRRALREFRFNRTTASGRPLDGSFTLRIEFPAPDVASPTRAGADPQAGDTASGRVLRGPSHEVFERHRPASLRGADVLAQLSIVVDTAGVPATIEVVEISHDEAAPAVRRAAREMRFRPAVADGERVRMHVTTSVRFPAAGASESGDRGQTVYDIADVDRSPRPTNGAALLREIEASYPPLLRDAGITGDVIVEVVVDPRGTTREVRVVEATRDEFGAVAREAVRRAKWTPAEVDGRPVAVRFSFPVQFTLADRASSRSGTAAGGDTVPQALLAEIRRRHPEVAAGRAPAAPLVVVRAEDGRIVQSFFGLQDEMNRRVESSRIAHIDVFKGSRVAGVGLPEGLIVITRSSEGRSGRVLGRALGSEPRDDEGATIRIRGDAGVPSALIDALRSRHPEMFSGGEGRGSLLVVESADGQLLDSFPLERAPGRADLDGIGLDPDQIERIDVLRSASPARGETPDLIRVTLKRGATYRPGASL